jgi:hypothetical protein
MLGEAFSAIGTAFSSRFVLGQFFPLFVVLTANLLLVCLYIWGFEPSLAYAKDHLQIASLTTAIGLVATVSCAIAFTISPLVNALERVLEGDIFRGKTRAQMLADLVAKVKAKSGAVKACRDAEAKTNRVCKETADAIMPLRKAKVEPPAEKPGPLHAALAWLEGTLLGGEPKKGDGAETPAPAPPLTDEEKKEEEAKTAIAHQDVKLLEKAQADLENAIWDATIASNPLWADIQKLMQTFVACMVTANKSVLALREPGALAKKYDITIASFASTQQRARTLVALQHSVAKSKFEQNFDVLNPKPTRFGNLRAALESYPRRAFGVDYDFLWPRILLVIGKDDPNGGLLDQRRAQLDFTLLMMLLTGLSFAAWIVGLSFTDRNLWRFFSVVIAAPVAIGLFNEIAIAAQRSFTELAKGCFDCYRFDLLTTLHVPPPKDDADERDLWNRVAGLSAGFRLNGALKLDGKP